MRTPDDDCRDRNARRRLIRARELNGIDYVEPDDDPTREPNLRLFFLGKAPEGLTEANVRIQGGARIRDIRVVRVQPCRNEDPEEDDCLRVYVDKVGDFSTYTLCLVNAEQGRPGETPLDGFDPRYACAEFSFRATCPTSLDCLPAHACAPAARTEPDINYLSKDYASFRQLILDRLALVMPEWKERHAPDIGVALVEVLAYVGDHLSYYQDAVAAEAYLDTARQRVSVRRHVALVDYRLSEGCNARAWVCVETSNDFEVGRREVYFTTGFGARARDLGVILEPEDLRGVRSSLYEVFEPLSAGPRRTLRFLRAHNRIEFYTWGERQCCLPRGSTAATLRDAWVVETPPDSPPEEEEQTKYVPPQKAGPSSEPREVETAYDSPTGEQTPQGFPFPYPPTEEPGQAPPAQNVERELRLEVGDVLIFEEVRGSKSGLPEDADPARRHAVRLTKVTHGFDQLHGQPVVEIEWDEEDALPFDLCLSALASAPGCEYLENVSVARGNVVLCDHGRTVTSDWWDVLPAEERDAGCLEELEPAETTLRAARFRPRLERTPLTYREAYPSARAVARQQARVLALVIPRVRARVNVVWEKTRDGEPLTREEAAELIDIFGAAALARAGLSVDEHGDPLPRDAQGQADALRRVLARREGLLGSKQRRVRTLLRRALAGYLLTRAEKRELRGLFGAAYVSGLAAARSTGAASAALRQSPREALPCVRVSERRTPDPTAGEEGAGDDDKHDAKPPRWVPRHNLLGSRAADRHFVAEIDNEGFAHLRFGDGELGRAPEPGTALRATYRVGNGRAGNVGREAITHVVFRRNRQSGLTLVVRNPLAAAGGSEPEPTAEAKMFAPGAFRHEMERAITAADYAFLAGREHPSDVQRGAGTLRWTGSWHEAQVAIDPRGGEQAGEPLIAAVEDSLGRYRRVGHDLRVRTARYVPLRLKLDVCVLPHFLRGHVRAALQEVFGSGVLPDGRRGFFHPDNLSFGDSIYVSRLIAAAQAVAGVDSLKVSELYRLGEAQRNELETGVLRIGPYEVAQLSNDRNFPERGELVINLRGGR